MCKTLKSIHNDNVSRLVFAHLNVNSSEINLNFYKNQIKGNIDILIFPKQKLTTPFLKVNFFIEGFSTPSRLDRDSNDGGILLYVREDVPSNLIAIENKPIESFFVS